MTELVLEFEPWISADPTEVGFSWDAKLGAIKLLARDHPEAKGEVLLDIKWDVKELLRWLDENAGSIVEVPLPEFVEWKGSIYNSIDGFYERSEGVGDVEDDAVFEFRQSHGIRFALRGVDVPDIYLGCGPNGGEISGEIEGRRFVFCVDIRDFLSTLIK